MLGDHLLVDLDKFLLAEYSHKIPANASEQPERLPICSTHIPLPVMGLQKLLEYIIILCKALYRWHLSFLQVKVPLQEDSSRLGQLSMKMVWGSTIKYVQWKIDAISFRIFNITHVFGLQWWTYTPGPNSVMCSILRVDNHLPVNDRILTRWGFTVDNW